MHASDFFLLPQYYHNSSISSNLTDSETTSFGELFPLSKYNRQEELTSPCCLLPLTNTPFSSSSSSSSGRSVTPVIYIRTKTPSASPNHFSKSPQIQYASVESNFSVNSNYVESNTENKNLSSNSSFPNSADEIRNSSSSSSCSSASRCNSLDHLSPLEPHTSRSSSKDSQCSFSSCSSSSSSCHSFHSSCDNK
jgi:hypothetical protein